MGELVHGATLVTNAGIERKGAKLGLLTTKGFRASLEMGKEQRYDIFDLFLKFPEVLVPRERRLEETERVLASATPATAVLTRSKPISSPAASSPPALRPITPFHPSSTHLQALASALTTMFALLTLSFSKRREREAEARLL